MHRWKAFWRYVGLYLIHHHVKAERRRAYRHAKFNRRNARPQDFSDLMDPTDDHHG